MTNILKGDYVNKLTVDYINTSVKEAPEKIISESENRYKSIIDTTAERICSSKGRTLVMVAGPSSSGKTTTSKLLKKAIEEKGRRAKMISLDDFYRSHGAIYTFEDGTVDYETVKALDVDYIGECLHSLMNEGRCRLPRFSFKTKKREYYVETVAAQDDIIIVEGLHALNPVITDQLENEQMVKIYVSVSSRIFDGDEVLMSKRDIRLLRRMIRDYHHRDSSPENTFYLWNGVRMGEDRYLFPFEDRADIKIDSIHPYEVCAFKDVGIKVLDRTDKKSVYYPEAQRLKDKISRFISVGESSVPEGSLLNEFIG
ncbi:MAG: nucleoside kinase [Clostridia bacterium]|nr:nucleoside kinase [Clostridia bacterium]